MYACYCIYNEEYFLRQSLQSIAPFVDKVIVIDGAWSTYTKSDFASTDASKQIAKEVCGKKLIWVDSPENGWTDESEKRSKYIELVPDGEWFIICDADETIHGDLKTEFKALETSDFHYCLLPTRLHTPFVKTLNYEKLNGFGGYFDANNPYAATYLKVFDTEEKFNKMSWISYVGHRYACYKKEPEMHYGKHHSQIFVGDTLIFDKYPEQRKYIDDKLVLNDLKYLRPYKRWKQNMEERTKRVSTEFIETGKSTPQSTQWKLDIEKYKRPTPLKREDVKPLMIIRSPRDSEFIKKNFATIDTVDQLWVKHYPTFEANQKLLEYIKEHKDEYTHVVFTTDDVIFSKQDFEQIMNDICQYDFPIITGVCNFCTTWTSGKNRCDACEDNFEHEWLSATFMPLRDVPNGGFLHDKRTPYLSRATYDFIPMKWAKENQIIKPVYFHGIALSAIRMDIFLQMDGLHLYNREKHIEADDVSLAIYCYEHDIPQMADFKVIVRHYGRHDIYDANMNIKSGSRLELISKSAVPELFQQSNRKVSNEEELKAEYEELCKKLQQNCIMIPQRPTGFGVTVFDNITNHSINESEWDILYGKYAKFIK